MAKKTLKPVERGGGNVFADLECPDAGVHLSKAKLVARIGEIIHRRGLKRAEAAKILGLSQPDVSRLLRGSFREYSVKRLRRLLAVLGRDAEIVIRAPVQDDRADPASERDRRVIAAAGDH